MKSTFFPELVRRLPEADIPFPGVSAWLLQGEKQQLVFMEFDQDVDVPEHSHEA